MEAQTEKASMWGLATFNVTLGHKDRMRWLSVLCVGGIVAAVVFAIIGGFPIDMPMFTHRFGLVTPSCGLTRGSTALVRGDVALAWRYNPASFAVIAFGIFGALRLMVGVITGRWLNVQVRPQLLGMLVLFLAFAVFAVYQQQHAEFIINSRQ